MHVVCLFFCFLSIITLVVAQVRIAKFIDDLEVLEMQCNELQYWGEINQLPKYVSRAKHLDEK